MRDVSQDLKFLPSSLETSLLIPQFYFSLCINSSMLCFSLFQYSPSIFRVLPFVFTRSVSYRWSEKFLRLKEKKADDDEVDDTNLSDILDEIGDVEGLTDLLSNDAESSLVPESTKIPQKVLVMPMFRKPLFPRVMLPLLVQNKLFVDKLLEIQKKGEFVGCFLVKKGEETGTGEAVSGLDEVKSLKQMHSVGVLGRIIRLVPNRGLGAQVFLAGQKRILAESEAHSKRSHKPFLVANIKPHITQKYNPKDVRIQAYTHQIAGTVREILKLNPFARGQVEALMNSLDLSDPEELADLGASIASSDSELLQQCLELSSVPERLGKVLLLLRAELDLNKFQEKVSRDIDEKINKQQRRHLLMHQLKAIKKELGLESDEKENVVSKFRERISSMKLNEEAKKVIEGEMMKLETLDTSSAEYNVCRNYLDWLTSLPWGKSSADALNITRAQEVLNEDHYGLDDVKERLLEFLAVGNLRGSIQGKILCMAGPPGTGKTSVGRSIARALKRKFYRFSVGGLGDVAEIKGHRRTYVGAMPGKLVQALKLVQTNNPVIMIDEIDKLGKGLQGDPASALLEALDPEQNCQFLDHFLDVHFDLSNVLFVCTANDLDTIPPPLLDRMEIIRLSGYVMEEKIEIAKNYLIPRAMEETGLTSNQVEILDNCVEELVRSHCREAGVRGLQKQIEKILRKSAFKVVNGGETEKIIVSRENVEDFVGKARFTSERYYERTPIGVTMGMAWSGVGGSVLYVESSSTKNSQEQGTVSITGYLGEVMHESVDLALTYAKGYMSDHFPDNKFLFGENDIHIHFPEGAIPKDGPSAGCTIATSLLSLALSRPVRDNLAMTGEITLTGKVLPIGGVKEKLMAAKRSGVTDVCLPITNTKDWEELPSFITDGLVPHFVRHYDDVFSIALEKS